MRALLALALFAGPAAADDLARGEELFGGAAEPACGICHTLAAAGTAGEIGPSLDELKPDPERVRLAVTQGVGVMPAYEDTLSADDIAAVAAYVAQATGAD